jgi:alpha-glucosidase (family GH31 glycosyl hydrolase)
MRALAPLLLALGCTTAAPSVPDASRDATPVDATPADAAPLDAEPPVDAPSCDYDGGTDDAPEPTPHTPRWAFEPWISKDISTTDDTYAFVDGFRSRGIPVGAVVLDSPWETHYNTFVPAPARYPRFDTLVREMHQRDVRVVLWITALVNSYSFDVEVGGDSYEGASPNFAQGLACNFFINDGVTWPWWKGRGASVDFFNPRAMAWWHRQQDAVLAAGIDGWKLDFGDSYVTADPVATAAGAVPHQRYSEAYYRDFLAYGRQRRGAEFLTMVRAWDASYQYAGRFFARREHAPVAWMGDNRRDRVGMIDALDHMFRSAAANYPVVGSDLGGYLDRDDRMLTTEVPYDGDTFERWIALGALTPFMQLHGRANFAPWTVPTRAEEITDAYRFWARLHHAMVPFWYALSQAAWADGAPILRPLGTMASWPGDYRYTLGDALLVAPVLNESGRRDVELPAGTWYNWWAPAADALSGSTTLRAVDTSDRARIPLYVRRGAIIPLRVDADLAGLGNATAAGSLTVLIYPDTAPSRFVLHEGATPAPVEVTPTATGVTVTVPASTTAWYLRVRADTPYRTASLGSVNVPQRASRAALDADPTGLWLDDASRAAWVRFPAADAPQTVTLTR